MQSLLVALSNNARMFGMLFSPSKCKLLLQDWSASTPELRIGSEVVERVDNFTYLGSLISPNGLVCDEISARIRKARLAFANLRHLWRRRDIRLSIKGRVYCAAVRSVLIYGSETWPSRVEDTPISTYQKILEHESNNQKAKEGMKKAQKLLKSSNRRDYYKILGVPKSASKKDILKAYRKMAAEYHPDKFQGEEKVQAEKKFVLISAAKEVLTDDEKRTQFENGIDPLDPEQQAQNPFGGHPFNGFPFSHMHPFEGAHFEFHFG
ncbi:unnamed protein product [Schistosoma margrebowiei]|uniref:Uncharacterized protein n=1 Tax=Schistosoma margrebowiei TaxID=48269 RepID=A0A183LT10_9TREM|nr:unnamed protein product [Schistosoma margrebowiei]